MTETEQSLTKTRIWRNQMFFFYRIVYFFVPIEPVLSREFSHYINLHKKTIKMGTIAIYEYLTRV